MVVFTFSVFDWKQLFWGKFSPKYHNCQFKLKFGTYTNSNTQNLVVMFTFSDVDWKHSFWANLVQKKENCQFKLTFGTKNNSNVQNSMVVFTFSVLDRKHKLFYCLCDRTGVETLKQTAAVNMAFLFCCGEYAGRLFLSIA